MCHFMMKEFTDILNSKLAVLAFSGLGLALVFAFLNQKINLPPEIHEIVDVGLSVLVALAFLLVSSAFSAGLVSSDHSVEGGGSGGVAGVVGGLTFALLLTVLGIYLISGFQDAFGRTFSATTLGSLTAATGIAVIYFGVRRLFRVSTVGEK